MKRFQRCVYATAMMWLSALLCGGCSADDEDQLLSLCVPAPAIQIAHANGTLFTHSEAKNYIVEYTEHEREMWIMCESDNFYDPIEAPDIEPMAPRFCGWPSSARPGEIHKLQLRVRGQHGVLVQNDVELPAQNCSTTGRKELILTITD